MTKPDLHQKLKKSHSEENLVSAQQTLKVPTVELERSKSDQPSSFNDPKYPYTTLISQTQELEKLRKESKAKSDTIKLLRTKIESLEEELKEESKFAKEMEELCENLRNNRPSSPQRIFVTTGTEQLEEKETQAIKELDRALFARHKNLKDWFSQYQQKKGLEQELAENVNEASNELINQDKVISGLRSQVVKLKNEKQSLSRDLELAQRAVAWRRSPLPVPTNSPWTLYALTFCLIGSLLWLMYG